MFHRFRPELAIKYGLAEAVLLYYVEFWCENNRLNNRTDHYQDGRWWMFNSAAAIAEELGYFNHFKVKRVLARLVECGALISGNYNKKVLDHTHWYTLGDEVLRLCNSAPTKVQFCTNDCANLHLRKCNSAPTMVQICTDNTNNKLNNKHNNKHNNKPINAAADGADAGSSSGWRAAIAILESVWGLTIDAVAAERIRDLETDFGHEMFCRAVSKAVRANERSPISARNVLKYISKTCAGLANGVDFDEQPLRKNDVAASAERARQELAEEESDGSERCDGSSSGSVWGVWERQ